MTPHAPSDRERREVETRLSALLDRTASDGELGRRIQRFAVAELVTTAPVLVAELLAEPVRADRCEHLPARFWFIAAEVFFHADRHADSRAALTRAFASSPREELDDQASGYFLLGVLESSHGDWERAVSAWERCLTLLPPGSDLELDVLFALGEGWEALGCADRASSRFLEALKLAAARNDVRGECHALYHLGRHARDHRCPDQALVYLEQAQTRAREEGYVAGECTAGIGIASVLLGTGEAAGARERLGHALASARELGDRLLTATALELLAALESREGDDAGARGALEEAIFLARGADCHAMLAALYHQLAVHHESGGRRTLAVSTYEKALRERRRAADAAGLGATLNNLASLYMTLGDLAAARRFFREALLAFNECGHDRKETDVVLDNIRRLDALADETLTDGAEKTDAPSPESNRESDASAGEDTHDDVQRNLSGRPLRPPIPFPGLGDRSD